VRLCVCVCHKRINEYVHIAFFPEKLKNSYKTFCVRPECVRDDVHFALLRGTPSQHTHTHTHAQKCAMTYVYVCHDLLTSVPRFI